MDTIIERRAGLDIGKKTLTARVRTPDGRDGRRSQTRTFSTMTRQPLMSRDWLASEQVTVVSMESTSTHWKAPSYLIEDDFEVWLLNAHHLKTVPGRKTDVKDAEWIARLTECGLVRASFVPPKPTRRPRDLTRYRKTVIEERGREAQRLEKPLEDTGIKLSSVASDILGVSGRAMLAQLVSGNTDPKAMAELAKGRTRPRIPALTEALTGWFDDHHALLVTEMLTRVDAAAATIARLDSQIDAELVSFAEALAPLDTIPGIGTRTARVICAGHRRRDRCGYEPVPHRRASGVVGWGLPRGE